MPNEKQGIRQWLTTSAKDLPRKCLLAGAHGLGSRLLRSSIDQPHAAVRDLDREGRSLCRSVQFPPAIWETVLTGQQSSQRNVCNSISG